MVNLDFQKDFQMSALSNSDKFEIIFQRYIELVNTNSVVWDDEQKFNEEEWDEEPDDSGIQYTVKPVN